MNITHNPDGSVTAEQDGYSVTQHGPLRRANERRAVDAVLRQIEQARIKARDDALRRGMGG